MNKSFEIFRGFTYLYSHNKKLSEIFRILRIKKIYLYGLGEMGRNVILCLKNDGIIEAVSDVKINKTGMLYDDQLGKVMGYKPEDIPDDDVPIIVTIADNVCGVRRELETKGVRPERIISLNILLKLAKYLLCEEKEENINCDKEYLIVGSNFDNKGSQAMAFTVVNAIRKKYESAIVWFCPNYWDSLYESNKYRMIFLNDGYCEESSVHELIPRIDAIFDVSGYAMSSIPGFGGTDRMMDFMKMAYDYNVPYFIMPQSFGPFDYPDYKKAELNVLLSSCRMIFPREESGYKLLKDTFNLENIEKSHDMVLQNKSFDARNIYISEEKLDIDVRDVADKVGIIPNTALHFYMTDEKVVNIYKEVIDQLLLKGKNVYIIPHSDDSNLCESINELYINEKKVTYLNGDYDCIEFESLIKDFEFLVASRFHSIVHAYRQSVPCVIIGWADKYNELAELMKQKDYLYDVRTKNDEKKLEEMIGKMVDNNYKNREIIESIVSKIQEKSCFDKVWELLEL